MTQLRAYHEIPYITSPRNLMAQLGPFLVKTYEQHGSLFRTQNPFGEGEVLYMIGPEANRFVLTTNRLKFSHHGGWGLDGKVEPKFGHGLLVMDGDEHSQHRKILNPAFTANAISERYFGNMCQIIDTYIQRWDTQNVVDIHEECRRITFAVIAQMLLGLTDPDEIESICHVVTLLIHHGEVPLGPVEYAQKLADARERLDALVKPKIVQHREQGIRNDILGDLLAATDDSGKNVLDDEQILAHVYILLVAGHETTTSVAAWLLYLLNQHPDYLQRVLDELDSVMPAPAKPSVAALKQLNALDNALSEAERLYPSIGNGPRQVLEDFEFNGYLIPAGTRVYYSIIGTQLLPELFADPTKFDPDRFAPPREEQKTPYGIVAFGGGPRICLGLNLAQLEIKLIAVYVLRRYRLELAPGQKNVQIYVASGAPYKGIRMKVSPLEASRQA